MLGNAVFLFAFVIFLPSPGNLCSVFCGSKMACVEQGSLASTCKGFKGCYKKCPVGTYPLNQTEINPSNGECRNN